MGERADKMEIRGFTIHHSAFVDFRDLCEKTWKHEK
jgi:hypothetical protein